MNWVIDQTELGSALAQLADALPDPVGAENRRDALERAITRGAVLLACNGIHDRPRAGDPSDRARRLAAACRLRFLAARGAVRFAQLPSGPGAVGPHRDARRRRLPADGTRRRADGGSAEHRPLAARPRRVGRSAERAAAVGPRPAGARPTAGFSAGFRARPPVSRDDVGAGTSAS